MELVIQGPQDVGTVVKALRVYGLTLMPVHRGAIEPQLEPYTRVFADIVTVQTLLSRIHWDFAKADELVEKMA